MYANHFRIKIIEKDNKFHVEVPCKYCQENQFLPTRYFNTEDEAWKNVKTEYMNKNGDKGLDIHLMVCHKFQETLK